MSASELIGPFREVSQEIISKDMTKEAQAIGNLASRKVVQKQEVDELYQLLRPNETQFKGYIRRVTPERSVSRVYNAVKRIDQAIGEIKKLLNNPALNLDKRIKLEKNLKALDVVELSKGVAKYIQWQRAHLDGQKGTNKMLDELEGIKGKWDDANFKHWETHELGRLKDAMSEKLETQQDVLNTLALSEEVMNCAKQQLSEEKLKEACHQVLMIQQQLLALTAIKVNSMDIKGANRQLGERTLLHLREFVKNERELNVNMRNAGQLLKTWYGADLIDEAEYQIIHDSLKKVLDVNEKVVALLSGGEEEDDDILSKVLAAYSPAQLYEYYQVLFEYSYRYPRIREIMSDAEKKRDLEYQVAAFKLDKEEENPFRLEWFTLENKLSRDFLSQPMQRSMRIQLTLKEVVKQCQDEEVQVILKQLCFLAQTHAGVLNWRMDVS